MQLVIISGPPNAGKSAAADALCQRYDRMLHIDVERLRDQLCMGRLHPWDTSNEGLRQRDLFIGCACDVASRFLDAGYGVVIDDVIAQEELAAYQACLVNRMEPIHYVALLPPPPEAVVPTPRRDHARLVGLHERFASWTGIARIDPTGLTPELVADKIMALASEGRAEPPPRLL